MTMITTMTTDSILFAERAHRLIASRRHSISMSRTFLESPSTTIGVFMEKSCRHLTTFHRVHVACGTYHCRSPLPALIPSPLSYENKVKHHQLTHQLHDFLLANEYVQISQCWTGAQHNDCAPNEYPHICVSVSIDMDFDRFHLTANE